MGFFKKQETPMIQKVSIKFESPNEAETFDFPKGIRIPNIGEEVWFSVFHQGKVTKIYNKLHKNIFWITIHVKQDNQSDE